MKKERGHLHARVLALSIALAFFGSTARAEGVRDSDVPSRPSSAFELTMADAIALAIRQNRAVQSAYLQRIDQKFALYVSEGKFYPRLNVTTSALASKANGVSSITKDVAASATLTLPTGANLSLTDTRSLSAGNALSSATALTLAQPLLKDGGLEVNNASVRIAQLDEDANRLALKATVSQTVVQVIYAYRELLRAQEQKVIAGAALKRTQALYETNKALIATGRMAEVELLQTQADVATREVAVEEALNQIDTFRLSLLSLLALEPRTPLVAVQSGPVAQKVVDAEQALETARRLQPDYLIAKIRHERARINLAYAKNQQLWDLSLVASWSQTKASANGPDLGGGGFQTGRTRSDSSFAGLQLSIPLGDRTIKQTEVRAAVDVQTQELNELDIGQVLTQRVLDATRNVETRWRQLMLSATARDLSVLKLNAEKDKLQVGRSSNFQVLSFESDLRNAENARLNAEIAYQNALTDLDERIGSTLDVWQIPLTEPAPYEH